MIEVSDNVTRAEHVRWCKVRALEYIDRGDLQGGITSMLSDLGKHGETAGLAHTMGLVAMFELMNPTERGARRFIEGFTE